MTRKSAKYPHGKYHIVSWWPHWQGFGFWRVPPLSRIHDRERRRRLENDGTHAYGWLLWFGWWEIRKWRAVK